MDDQEHAQPLVTVVLPTADRPRYLEESLRSAVGQSYRNIEILVRDNASGPETGEIVRRFPDERIHYLRHEQNIGMTPNVLGAFREAKGKYVTNLHDDDFWEPDFLAKTVAALETNPDVVLAFSDHYIVDQTGAIDPEATKRTTAIFKRTRLAPGIHKPFKELALIDFSVPLAMASVLRRDSIDWDDFPNFVSTYDLWLVYLACRNGDACYYLPERLTSYRVHSASESALGRVRLNKAFIEIYERMLLDPRVAEFHGIFRKRLGIHHTDAAIALLRRGEHAAAREMLTGGMPYRFDIKANLAYVASYLPRMITRHLPGKLGFPVPHRYLDYIGTSRDESAAAC
jgi:glycosyltransferase involved in cell wall biosynthesis